MKKIGFIGMGNMAQALAKGLIRGGKVAAADIYAFAPNQAKLQKNAEAIGFHPCASPAEAVGAADLVVMACKPYQMEAVIGGLRDGLKGKAIVSVAAGWDLEKAATVLPEEARYQYMMPNTPIAVGEGVAVMEETHTLLPEERRELEEWLATTAKVVVVKTHLMNAATGISGCSGAFVDMIIEALGDGAVKNGVPRAQAYELVCQTLIGAAKLQLETGLHPGELKDQVCSPGGITIKGVAVLEEKGLRAALIQAVDAVSQ